MTQIHKQNLHEMKSVSYKTAGCSRKSMDLEPQASVITVCEILGKLLTLSEINKCL